MHFLELALFVQIPDNQKRGYKHEKKKEVLKTHCKHTGYPLEESLEHISQACIFGRRTVGRRNRRRWGKAGSRRGGWRGDGRGGG